jgi:hypothetical protein
MDLNTLQQLFGRGINPGTAGAVQTKKSVGSAAPRIPRPAAPVPVGRPFNPANPIVGPRGTSAVPTPKGLLNFGNLVRGGLPALAAEGALMLGDRLIPGGVPSEIRGAVQGGAWGSMLGPAGTTFGVLAGADLANERGRGAGSMTGEFERGTLKLDPLEARRLYMDQVPGPVRSMDNDADDAATYNTQTGKYTFDSSVVDRSTTPTSDPRNTDLPVSAEQVAPVDPYAYQLSVYGQGRQAANSQEAMNKVRDLGLAIHQAKYPQFYRESYNPLMAATFPERYQKTPENFVVQQGIQVPSAMTAKDSRAELLQSEEEANIERLDQSTAAVEAFLANYLNKGAK